MTTEEKVRRFEKALALRLISAAMIDSRSSRLPAIGAWNGAGGRLTGRTVISVLPAAERDINGTASVFQHQRRP